MEELLEWLEETLGRKINQVKLFGHCYAQKTNAVDYLYKLLNSNRLDREFEIAQIKLAQLWEEEL